MGRSLDIANLYRAFGGDPQRYREFEPPETPSEGATLPALVTPESAPLPMPFASLPASVAAQSPSAPAVAEVAEQAPGELPPLHRELEQRQSVRSAEIAVAALNQALHQAPPSRPASVVAVVSAKGGTGKTVVAAGLAQGLARRGRAVLLVELDAQNVLASLLKVQKPMALGASEMPLAASVTVADNLRLVPFGLLDETGLPALEQTLALDPHWLARQLLALEVPVDTLVILDCPTGSTPLGRQALALATQVVGVTTADAVGYASLPRLERQLQRSAQPTATFHLLNRVDPARPLTQDIAAVVAQSWGARLLGVLPESQALEQALALGQGLQQVDDAWSSALAELGARLLDDITDAARQAIS